MICRQIPTNFLKLHPFSFKAKTCEEKRVLPDEVCINPVKNRHTHAIVG
jgi:hypothetical protein